MNRLPLRHALAGPPNRPAAFTLVELLVAATLALVVMAALASLFGIFGRAVADSQELVQLAARMRSAAWRLRQDLQGATTEAKPFIRSESACGYLEIIEGPLVETGTTTVADVDDILMLTTSSPGRPFTGLLSGSVALESPLAEVAWFCKIGPRTADGLQLYNLYRRQLLVAAAPGAGMLTTTNTASVVLNPTVVGSGTFAAWDYFFPANELSVRREGDTLIVNSLADLTRRHSRFLHNACGVTGTAPLACNAEVGPVPQTVGFSWPQITTTSTIPGAGDVLLGTREGEDLILANVIAFDMRVFDPQLTATGNSYVDLGRGGNTLLSSPAAVALSGSGVPLFSATTSNLVLGPGVTVIRMVPGWGLAQSTFYDASSMHTESNNIADMVHPNPDTIILAQERGSNLIDDNGNGVIDDVGELEQTPPYNVPLRGVEIRLRCYEPSSQEVRQITVQHSFLAR